MINSLYVLLLEYYDARNTYP